MDKEKTKNSILKAIQEERFEELVKTNFDVTSFITGEIRNNSPFIINLRKELLKSKEDFNFNENPVITNLLLCVYSSSLNIILKEIIRLKKELVLIKEPEEALIEWLNNELYNYLKQKEFIFDIQKNIIISNLLLKKFEETLEVVNEEIIDLINYIRIGQMIRIRMTGMGMIKE